MSASCGDSRSGDIWKSSSDGVSSGVGEGSVTCAMKKGGLCGSGDSSIVSMPGEEEGIGGVVAPSATIGGVRSSF